MIRVSTGNRDDRFTPPLHSQVPICVPGLPIPLVGPPHCHAKTTLKASRLRSLPVQTSVDPPGAIELDSEKFICFGRTAVPQSNAADCDPVDQKIIEVKIIDDEEYEKNKSFIIELGEPVLLEIGQKHGDSNENKPLVGAEEEEVAKMGCPSLGEHTHSTVDKLIKKTNLALVVGSSSWREQFVSAVTVSAGDDDEEESGEERLPSCFDYIMHFLTVFWKVLFAFVPPTEYWNGWACFFVSISLIGVLTAVTGDLASHFGCTIGLKDSVTAVVFVALGTSVPDTFASKVAAIQDQYADASIGNVTGSNAVNVFLGIGVAWTIAAVAWRSKGKTFKVDPGNLAFSVTLFTILAVVCVFILLYRRRATVAGGELGGPRTCKAITSLVFVSLWLIYIMLASMEAYCHLPWF
ncbi:hypothetical protein PAMA_013984 [Pampus argenteus]